jgi:hypothetical protein
MALPELERNDVVLTKDGREMRILSIYKSNNTVHRVEAVDDSKDIPTRTTIYANNIMKILRKHIKPVEPAPVAAPVVERPAQKGKVK